jgi:hypothetical protein
MLIRSLLLIAMVAYNAPSRSMQDLVFLTRPGCVNTAVMRANLDKALKALKLQTDYQFIDIDTLPVSDVRTGYPTPTLLYKGRDLFGMPEPKPPLHAPT